MVWSCAADPQACPALCRHQGLQSDEPLRRGLQEGQPVPQHAQEEGWPAAQGHPGK